MLVPLRGGRGRWCSVLNVLYSTFGSLGGVKWWVGDGGGGCACPGPRGAG
jgi:hypothetical protein